MKMLLLTKFLRQLDTCLAVWVVPGAHMYSIKTGNNK